MAFAISAVSGGGAGLIILPVLSTVLPGAQVPAALSIGTTFSSVSRLLAFRKYVRWGIVFWFVPPALPTVWLGAWLLRYVNPLYLEVFLGLFLLANLPLLFRPTKELEEAHRFPKIYLSVIGAAAGFVSGLTGAVGLLFNRFYLRYGLCKEEIVATRAANELILHLIKLYLYASFGLLSSEAIAVGSIVAVGAILSALMMRWFLPLLSEALFRRLGYLAMSIAGVAMCIGVGHAVATENRVSMNYSPIASGVEAKLQWRESQIALEFEYDEGFEYERRIPFSHLPLDRQAKVQLWAKGADRVLIEEVFGIGKHSYEAYVFRQGKLTKFEL